MSSTLKSITPDPRPRGGVLEYLPAILAVIGGLALTAVLTISMYNHGRDVAQFDFSEEAKGCVGAVERELRSSIDLVRWLGAVMTASPDLEPSAFEAMARSLAKAPPPVHLMWAPVVSSGAPAAQSARPVPGAVSPVEIPVAAWRAPILHAPALPEALGLDLATDPETGRYLARAAETGRMFFSTDTAVTRALLGEASLLAICPVYGGVEGEADPESLRGFALGLVPVGPLAEAAFAPMVAPEVDVHLFDFFQMPGRQFLHYRPGPSQGAREAYLHDVHPASLGTPHYVGAIDLGDSRRWLVACTPSPAYTLGIQSWSPYLGLIFGLAFTALMAWHFHANVRQRRAAEALVLRRTAALRRTNERLLLEAAARERFELERDGLLTLLEESNTTLQQVNGRLEQSNRDLQDFALVASHDLKEPLRKVRALAQTLRDKLSDRLEPGGGEYLDLMEGVLERMHALITNLLRVSRVTTHGQPFEAVDMGQVIAEVISDLAVRIKETGGEIDVGEMPAVEADPLQMRQFVQNILDNGLKYHREGVPPRIVVEGRDEPGACSIVFRDNGIGFAPELAERAFTLFQRLDNGARVEGSGMGLAVCRKIAERHGGTLRVESKTGCGSTFTITLPRARNGQGAVA